MSEPFFAAWAESQGAAEPPGFARVFFLPVAFFLAWAAWRDRARAGAALMALPVLAALIALAFASSFWSIDGAATFRRSFWLALTTGFGLYLAWRYDWRGLIQVLAGAVLILVVGSFALGLLAPDIGRMSEVHPGAWGGLWTHKNTLGGIMAIGACICVSAAIIAPERRRLWLATGLGALALVLLSTSMTALVATLLGAGIITASALVRRGPMPALFVALGALAITLIGGAIVLVAPDVVVAALGRDITLTGRTDIWQASANAVDARPWLGWGYGVFWLSETGPAYWVRQAVQWEVASAHSGWLELSLAMGRVGVALFALQFAVTMWRGAGAVMKMQAGLWAPAFLAVFALYTLSESHVLAANNLIWTIYVAVAARLALDAREREHT